MKYSKKTIAYCLEQIVGNNKTAAEVSRETGVGEQTISLWLSKHWFGSRSFEDFETRESIINPSDNLKIH